jgi:hypothetical protein
LRDPPALAGDLQFGPGMDMFRAVYVSWIVLAGVGTPRADEAAPIAAQPPTASLGGSIAISGSAA